MVHKPHQGDNPQKRMFPSGIYIYPPFHPYSARRVCRQVEEIKIRTTSNTPLISYQIWNARERGWGGGRHWTTQHMCMQTCCLGLNNKEAAGQLWCWALLCTIWGLQLTNLISFINEAFVNRIRILDLITWSLWPPIGLLLASTFREGWLPLKMKFCSR